MVRLIYARKMSKITYHIFVHETDLGSVLTLPNRHELLIRVERGLLHFLHARVVLLEAGRVVVVEGTLVLQVVGRNLILELTALTAELVMNLQLTCLMIASHDIVLLYLHARLCLITILVH